MYGDRKNGNINGKKVKYIEMRTDMNVINKNKLLTLVEKLEQEHTLTREEWITLITGRDEKLAMEVFQRAVKIRKNIYGDEVFVRGLIEFTNYCKNDCYYCGIRRSNQEARRYRLSMDEIMECCNQGYHLGFRTFVLQGGEDAYYTDERLVNIIEKIKGCYPDCALTLSIGEKARESYQVYFDAGADRYLLRHETASEAHYGKLHPRELSLEKRKRCLYDLKEIGYEVGCGFMVGAPYQTAAELAKDMLFLRELEPDMVGIGPFVPHHKTPFAEETPGSVELTTYMLGLIRLMLPYVLLPATTALGTIDPLGREKGIQAGANVVMPNLSPVSVRKKYELYDNKICTGDEAAECKNCLNQRMENIGYHLVVHKGGVRKNQSGSSSWKGTTNI